MLHGIELMAKKRKRASFDSILKLAFKDQAWKIKLGKLAKVLDRIVPRKLARFGLESILE